MILSREEILRAVKEKRLGVNPFSEANVGPCSIDLTLGNEFKRFRPSRKPLLVGEAAHEEKERSEIVQVRDGGSITLKPGELVLGITKERLKLPQDLCGHLEGRSRLARLGLMVHVSSSLVQPGVDNVQVLEIVNLSPHGLVLKPGLRVCQVVLMELKGKAAYRGEFSKQRGVQ